MARMTRDRKAYLIELATALVKLGREHRVAEIEADGVRVVLEQPVECHDAIGFDAAPTVDTLADETDDA